MTPPRFVYRPGERVIAMARGVRAEAVVLTVRDGAVESARVDDARSERNGGEVRAGRDESNPLDPGYKPSSATWEVEFWPLAVWPLLLRHERELRGALERNNAKSAQVAVLQEAVKALGVNIRFDGSAP